METRVHTVIGTVLALMFGAFAALQLNDPDPLAWIFVYGFLMAIVVMNIFRPLPLMICVLPMLAAIAGAILLWPENYEGITGKMDGPDSGIELARESLGLLICAAACAYIAARSYVRGKKRQLVE